MIDEKQETKDDILAELRRQSNKEHELATKLRSGDCDDVDYACASCYDEDAKYLSQIADRIEAATKREKAQIGNSAALREAFNEIIVKIDAWRTDGMMEHWQYSQLFDIADAALALPLRQCDEPNEQGQMRGMSFAEAMEHFKKGRLIRRAGDHLWCWLGKSGSIYYGLKRDCPLQFRDTWLTSDIFSDDWEVQEEGGAE